MTTYKCARELIDACLQRGDWIDFSNVGIFQVEHNSVGWYLIGLSKSNDAVFKYLYDTKSPYACIKELGDYLMIEGGIFPYLKSAEALTEVVGKLLLEVERKRLKEFDFGAYVPKGTIAPLSSRIVFKLCKNQVEQGNVFDLRLFENDFTENRETGGMDWSKSFEGMLFWTSVYHSLTTEAKTQPISPSSSLAALSARKTQKPKLKTL